MYNKCVRRGRLALYAFLSLSFLISYAQPASILAGDKRLVFCTWEGFEVDKCASIWLIKRFVDNNAVISFFPKGEAIKEGIPFDTPDAKFRRYHNMSTFESLLRHYQLNDPKLVYIGEIIHDIEVNIWEKKRFDETLVVLDEINKIIRNGKTSEAIMEASCKYFDWLYENASVQRNVPEK